jgi:two-component system NtrC family response regulator
MREDVVIVLNEREPLKKQMANELSEQLGLRGIAQHRLRPEGDLAELISMRRPKVLVLDYILGDVGTALDLLARFRDDNSEQIKIIVWTDEPSVGAAVTALKLGAYDYVEMLPKLSLERVLLTIESAIESIPDQSVSNSIHTKVSPLPPIGDSLQFKKCLSLAERHSQSPGGIAVLLGPKGCGRNRIAEYMHTRRSEAGSYFSIDFDLFTGSLEQLFGNSENRIVPWLSNGATVFIDHVEFDTGELLETVEKEREIFKTDVAAPLLIVGTADTATAAAWNRLLDCPICAIPALNERVEDILPLLSYFNGRAVSGGRGSRVEFSAALVHKLAELTWPGNIRQLRAAAFESSLPVTRDRAQTEIAGLDRLSALIYESIFDAKERWEAFEQDRPISLNRFLVRKTIEQTDGNFRVAAARLGTGVPQLRQILGQPVEKEARK